MFQELSLFIRTCCYPLIHLASCLLAFSHGTIQLLIHFIHLVDQSVGRSVGRSLFLFIVHEIEIAKTFIGVTARFETSLAGRSVDKFRANFHFAECLVRRNSEGLTGS